MSICLRVCTGPIGNSYPDAQIYVAQMVLARTSVPYCMIAYMTGNIINLKYTVSQLTWGQNSNPFKYNITQQKKQNILTTLFTIYLA